ncbi:MAG: imidazoleglycerol-phosphate dehydratase HisB [Candidatus Hydrothermarchaeota archaeon]|jgi:imidazoleglycerol-phosphate dehydratase|nr:imidazoleglycerol-phosphate dehydratase HisB [Candidatus Hydrothermarchaeota archaeon]MDP6613146.1 imidazoleglycerol-phosphate dehydratase HisB [Candidatus Hydrothermarchaeota archaeon]
MRTSKIRRKTKETDVMGSLTIEGKGDYRIDTGAKFFDHLLSSFSRHGRFDLEVNTAGDNEHHIVEDVAIALGEAFREALGDKRGIRRFGSAIVPMDDILILTAIDIGGRGYCVNGVKFRRKKIEGLSSEMVAHFLTTFAGEFKINLHTMVLGGKNEHHKAEALFKSLGLSLREACGIVGEGIPSTKGVL